MKVIDVNDWEEPDTGETPYFRPASQVPLQHVDERSEPDGDDVQAFAHSSGQNRNTADSWGTTWTSADINNPAFGRRHVD
jgi:hypothetical protein